MTRLFARRLSAVALAIAAVALARPLAAQPKAKNVLPPTDKSPRLVLTHDRPAAPTHALAFAPDGNTLYVAGFDKQVRRYQLGKNGWEPGDAFRVPVGPGLGGVVNALAVAADPERPEGKWVAVAGRAPVRGEAWTGPADGLFESYRDDPDDVRGDAGIVYLFDPAGKAAGRAIRGPLRGVRAVAFANPAPAAGHVLVTAGIEMVNATERGVLRVFDVDSGEERAKYVGLPATRLPPAVVAFATGLKRDGLRVAVAWSTNDGKPGQLLVWDNPGPDTKPVMLPDLAANSTLSVRFNGASAELLSGGFGAKGGINVRADGKPLRFDPFADGDSCLPVGLAATARGTASLVRIVAGKGLRYEVRLLAPNAVPVPVAGVVGEPVFAASADGRFAAVAGLSDNRVEIHSLAALAGGKAEPPHVVRGAEPGFEQVRFLKGEKLWLGKRDDTIDKGGAILDLAEKVRAATPRGANEQLDLDAPDAPAAEVLAGNVPKGEPWRVRVTVGGKQSEIVLPAGGFEAEVVTAVAVLPAIPARNDDYGGDLGAAVAVAVRRPGSEDSRVKLSGSEYSRVKLSGSEDARIKLYRLADLVAGAGPTKPLYVLGGPTLPVRSLAFCGSRPLLAGAGDDGTAFVWSLKGVARPNPAVEGLLLTTREGKVVVSVVTADSPAKGLLKPDDAVEAVVDAKGDKQKVEVPGDFVQAVRTLKVGDVAKITAGGKDVQVKVGTAIGFRLPLFSAWVSPTAQGGKHAWVGWTPSGPYDASGPEAEVRIRWLTATGEPARPATLAGADQYRKLLYRKDFIRELLVSGGYRVGRELPRSPALTAEFPDATRRADGRLVTRSRIDALVKLSDPDNALDPSRAVVAWQLRAPDGTSEWVRESFASGTVAPKLTERAWVRGEYTVHAQLFATAADPVPLFEASATVRYVPPAPAFAVLIDGKPVEPKGTVTAANAKAVTVALDKAPAGAAVTVSWGKETAKLGAEPLTVPLAADVTEVIVSATNTGADPLSPDEETLTASVWVQRPAPVPPPVVILDVPDPTDPRPTGGPFVVSVEKARVRAVVSGGPAGGAFAVDKFEWQVGAGPWEEAKLTPDPAGGRTASGVRIVEFDALKPADLDKDGNAAIRTRATIKGVVTESVILLRRDGLPEITVDAPPAVVGPEVQLKGGLKVTSKRRFAVRVLVTSSRTGQTREFAPTPNAALTTWTADLTLFPGGNQLGYVVRYDSGVKDQLFANLVEVHLKQVPVILGGGPLAIDTADAGPLGVAVVSAASPPELRVDGAAVGASAGRKPVRVFGASVWAVAAPSAPARPEPKRLQEPVAVVAHNSEGESAAIEVKVEGVKRVVIAPPVVAVRYGGGPIAHGDVLSPTNDPNFTFELLARSDVPLARAEVWHGASADGPFERVEGAAPGKTVSARPTVRLRPGAGNYVKVVVANGGAPVEVGFHLTYLPPPVEVVIDSIRERGEKDATRVTPANAAALTAKKGKVEVKGRVIWHTGGEAVATDPFLSVVFVANGVSHLPVTVAKAEPGTRVREFSGWVYLNSADPTPKAPGTAVVRAELRSGGRLVPRADGTAAAVAITSAAPITRQRLHVVICGVSVAKGDQGALTRGVVSAIGGTWPADNPNFVEGEFKRDRFEMARVYRPRFENLQAGHLNAALDDIRRDIARRVRQEDADDEWVNDVILLYYQGSDWKDASGRWLLDSVTTAGPKKGPTAASEAISRDDLPPIPGMLVVVANVTGAKMDRDPLESGAPYLRYAWSDPAARANLLAAIDTAVRATRDVDEIRASVGTAVMRNPAFAGLPVEYLPREVLRRIVGLK